MELFGRLLFALALFSTILVCLVRLPGYTRKESKDWYPISRSSIRGKLLSQEDWRKRICGNRGMRRFVVRYRPKGDGGVDFPLLFLILLSGDVESNPGPVFPSLGSGEGTSNITNNETGLERLEMLVATGQSSIMEKLDGIMSRLDLFEKELKSVQDEVAEVGKRQAELAGEVDSARDEAHDLNCRMLDMNFVLDQQEQYSRKSSIRILGVEEKQAEDCEAVCIEAIKVNLGIDICDADIDIVHRVGRRLTGKARPILVKFASHKPKEKVMRKRKEAQNIKIVEDLAYGIKKVYDFLNANRREIDLEYVWTIDGRIKYKFTGDSRPYEIRSYADYDRLINKKR